MTSLSGVSLACRGHAWTDVGSEQRRRGGVEEVDTSVVIEDDGARRRHLQQALEEVVLLAHADPLGAQRVGHAVVDLDQPIDLGLAGRPEARRVVALLEQLRTLADERMGAQQAVDQPGPDHRESTSPPSIASRPHGDCLARRHASTPITTCSTSR